MPFLELLNDPTVWISFLTLTVLEIVLGIDNIIFISIVANKLPERSRALARFLGLLGALGLRLALLFSIAWLAGLTQPILGQFSWGEGAPWPLNMVSWRDLVLLSGGVFLLYKATMEIHAEMAPDDEDGAAAGAMLSFGAAVVQIMLFDLIFSFDSVITAVGIVDKIPVMFAAVILAIMVMMVASGPISRFVERNPSTKMLALAFLVMVGMALVADGAGVHIDRGFIYGAMAFSTFVEILNLNRQRRKRKAREKASA